MWVLTYAVLAISLGFLSAPIYADCGEPLEALGQGEKRSPVELQRRKVQNQLSEALGPVTWIETRYTYDEGPFNLSEYPHEIEFGYALGDNGLRFTDSSVKYTIDENGGLESYFRVDENLQNKGISKLLLLTLLERHPEIRSLDTTLIGTNISVFLTAVAAELEGSELYARSFEYGEDSPEELNMNALFIDEFRELSSPEEFKEWRDRVLKAVWQQTPAGRIRAALGFSRTERIDIVFTDTHVIEVGFSATKGEAHEATEIRAVDRTRSRTLIISQDGQTRVEEN